MNYILLVLILAGALLLDIKTGKISNKYILTGAFSLLIERLAKENVIDYRSILLSVFIPFICLLPFFALGLIGGGDVKVLMLTGIVFPPKGVVGVIILSVFAGAITGLVKTLKNGSLNLRFKKLFSYLNVCMNGSILGNCNSNNTYLEMMGVEEKKKFGIHFTAPILFGTVVVLFFNLKEVL